MMTDAGDPNVNQLVADLDSGDAVARKRARAALVRIGSAAVPRLVGALDAPQQHVRWEAAKSLGEIADRSAAARLAAALGDEDGDVRWVVAEALIAMGRDAVKPALTALTKPDLSVETCESVRHVLNDLAKRGESASLLEPVIKALKKAEPEIAAPVAAAQALQNLPR